MVKYNAHFSFPPPLEMFRGGGGWREIVVYTQPTIKKRPSQIWDFFGESFYFWGILFSSEQVCVGKILNLYIRGKFYFLGGNFQFGEILNLCF